MTVKKPSKIRQKFDKSSPVAEIIHSAKYSPSKGVFSCGGSTYSSRKMSEINRESPSFKTSVFSYHPKAQTTTLRERKYSHHTFYNFNLKMAGK